MDFAGAVKMSFVQVVCFGQVFQNCFSAYFRKLCMVLLIREQSPVQKNVDADNFLTKNTGNCEYLEPAIAMAFEA